jgi:hypothetical protein
MNWLGENRAGRDSVSDYWEIWDEVRSPRPKKEGKMQSKDILREQQKLES